MKNNIYKKLLLVNTFCCIIVPMPRTSNLYGKINITKRAIRNVVIITSGESYGVASVLDAKVKVDGNFIQISVQIYLKFGVSIDPTIENVRRAIKYNVENFTNMTVEHVNIDILGIQS